MTHDTSALKAAIKLLADFANDSMQMKSEGSPMEKILGFRNLVPDLMVLAPQISDLDDEAKALAPEDYDALIAELVADLQLPEGKAKNVVAASLKLLNHLVVVVAPDVEELVAAIQAK